MDFGWGCAAADFGLPGRSRSQTGIGNTCKTGDGEAEMQPIQRIVCPPNEGQKRRSPSG